MLKYLYKLKNIISYIHPEISYKLGKVLFSIPLPSCKCENKWRIGDVEVCGPVGVAAGLDKTGLFARFLSHFCPGFIVVGSTLPRNKPGNRPPRAARIAPMSLVNAMGLNSPGLPVVASRISRINYPLFLSIAGFSTADFLIQAKYALHLNIKAIEINLSSPTYGNIWNKGIDIELNFPVFIKIGPKQNLREIVKIIKRRGWGLTISNTLPIDDKRLSTGRGGLSGLLLFPLAYRMLLKARELAGLDTPIIFSGGVSSCAQLNRVLKVAQAVEILTSILYYGPGIIEYLNSCVSILGA